MFWILIFLWICVLLAIGNGLDILSENGVIYYNDSDLHVPITCQFNEQSTEQTVSWFEDDLLKISIFTSSCIVAVNSVAANIKCNTAGRQYTVEIPMTCIVDERSWNCQGHTDFNVHSLTAIVRKIVSISLLTIHSGSIDDNSVASITTGETQPFTCSTDTGRPAALIHWYIGGQNVTDHATFQTSPNGTGFVSSSTLVLTGRNAVHNKELYCEAFNIDESQKVKFNIITLDIHVPVMALTLTPTGINNSVIVVSGEAREFTCITDSSRPAVLIHWYLAGRNVTNDALQQPPQKVGTKYISSSKLVYTGNGRNIKKVVYCEAVNIYGIQEMKSANKTLLIGYLPDPVVEIKTVCDVANMAVMWRSESNGGNKQIFQVVWQDTFSDMQTRSDNVSDPGVGSIVYYSTNMSTNSYSTIIIESTNMYGTVRSNKQEYCNTSGTVVDLQVTEPTLSFSAGFGSGEALVVFLNIVVISAVLIWNRRRPAHTDGSNVYEQAKNRPGDANVYNELNENPKERQNPKGCGTYEDIGVGTKQTSNTDNERKGKALLISRQISVRSFVHPS